MFIINSVLNLLSVVIVSFSLSLDSFAVSVASGLSVKKALLKDALLIAIVFASVQAVAPFIGWFLGGSLPSFITEYGNLVAFVVLSYIGIKMFISGSRKKAMNKLRHLRPLTIIGLAIATSIDALAVGASFNLLQMPIMQLMILTFLFTFTLSYLGYIFGSRLGYSITHNANAIGGLALVLIGLKILLFS